MTHLEFVGLIFLLGLALLGIGEILKVISYKREENSYGENFYGENFYGEDSYAEDTGE